MSFSGNGFEKSYRTSFKSTSKIKFNTIETTFIFELVFPEEVLLGPRQNGAKVGWRGTHANCY